MIVCIMCFVFNDGYRQSKSHVSINLLPTSFFLYYLKITGNWNHMYINYLSAIEYTYLNLDVETTVCQFLKYINTQIHMTPSVKFVIKMR